MTDPAARELCACGHAKAAHADCGAGPCRTNVSLALWFDSDDRKDTACPCRGYREEVETPCVER